MNGTSLVTVAKVFQGESSISIEDVLNEPTEGEEIYSKEDITSFVQAFRSGFQGSQDTSEIKGSQERLKNELTVQKV